MCSQMACYKKISTYSIQKYKYSLFIYLIYLCFFVIDYLALNIVLSPVISADITQTTTRMSWKSAERVLPRESLDRPPSTLVTALLLWPEPRWCWSLVDSSWTLVSGWKLGVWKKKLVSQVSSSLMSAKALPANTDGVEHVATLALASAAPDWRSSWSQESLQSQFKGFSDMSKLAMLDSEPWNRSGLTVCQGMDRKLRESVGFPSLLSNPSPAQAGGGWIEKAAVSKALSFGQELKMIDLRFEFNSKALDSILWRLLEELKSSVEREGKPRKEEKTHIYYIADWAIFSDWKSRKRRRENGSGCLSILVWSDFPKKISSCHGRKTCFFWRLKYFLGARKKGIAVWDILLQFCWSTKVTHYLILSSICFLNFCCHSNWTSYVLDNANKA